MILAVRDKSHLAPIETTPIPRRENRQSAETALFGLYEISKILNAPVGLARLLARVANIPRPGRRTRRSCSSTCR